MLNAGLTNLRQQALPNRSAVQAKENIVSTRLFSNKMGSKPAFINLFSFVCSFISVSSFVPGWGAT